jgi:hypothetical protein
MPDYPRATDRGKRVAGLGFRRWEAIEEFRGCLAEFFAE